MHILSNLVTIHQDKLSDIIKRPDSYEESINWVIFLKRNTVQFKVLLAHFIYVFFDIQVPEPMLKETSLKLA